MTKFGGSSGVTFRVSTPWAYLALLAWPTFVLLVLYIPMRNGEWLAGTPVEWAIDALRISKRFAYYWPSSGRYETFDALGAGAMENPFAFVANLQNLMLPLVLPTPPTITLSYALLLSVPVVIFPLISTLRILWVLFGIGLIATSLVAGVGIDLNTRALPAFVAFILVVTTFSVLLAPARTWPLGLSAMALYIALFPFIREDSGAVILLFAACLGILSVALFGFLTIRKVSPKSPLVSLARRAAITSALLLVGYFVLRNFFRLVYASAWGISPSEVVLANHGMGHSLYLGLGFVSNPFNIAWSDDVGLIHGNQIQPGACPYYQQVCLDVLQRRFFEIVLEHPDLLVRNIFAKSLHILQLLAGAIPPQDTFTPGIRFDYLPQLSLVTIGAVGLLWVLRRSVTWATLTAISISMLSGIVASIAPPLIVFPNYISALTGVLVAIAGTFLILSVYLWGEQRSLPWSEPPPNTYSYQAVDSGHGKVGPAHSPRSARRRVLTASILVAALMALAVAFIGFLNSQARNPSPQEMLRAAPIQENSLASVFNSSAMEERNRLVGLAVSEGAVLFGPESGEEALGDSRACGPRYALAARDFLTVILCMPAGFDAQFARSNQGDFRLRLVVCSDCGEPIAGTVVPLAEGLWTNIPSWAWVGESRAFGFKLPRSDWLQHESLTVMLTDSFTGKVVDSWNLGSG